MSEQYRRGVPCQGFFDDFPGIHRGTVDRAAKHFLIVDDLVAIIEKQHGEYFMLAIAEHCLHVLFGAGGAGDFEARLEAV